MRTAFVTDWPRKTTLPQLKTPLKVVISAGSEPLRAQIEALARRSGAQLSAESDRYDVLLIALDSSTPLPSSTEALSLLNPSGGCACVIWTGKAPPRGTVSRLLRAGVAGVVSLDISPARFQSALRAMQDGLHVIDRESKRLNSSHRCTSYAVFFRKKNVDAPGDVV